jgi:hypothetical protein
LNVRAFLGLQGRKSVNAGLRRTILEAPGRFLAYNNGIVATVDGIETEALGTGAVGIKSLRGLQIVNGGQTTASLHRAHRQDSANLDHITVPAKIIRFRGADLNDLVSAVSKSANSQNTIQPADFSANDPFHVAVESLANNVWLSDGGGRWFYERARGSYSAAQATASKDNARAFAQETPKERRFSKTDLAKYLNAWDGLPHLVSCGSQKNFQFFMQALKDERADGFAPDEAWYKTFIAKAIVFRSVQNLVRRARFPAYQANITAYTVALLGFKFERAFDFAVVWQHQEISAALRKLLEGWAAAIDSELRRTAKDRMPSEWAKKLDCWDALRELELDLPASAILELRSQGPSDNAENGADEVESLESAGSDVDHADVIGSIRRAFNRTTPLDREGAIRHLAEYLKSQQIEGGKYEDLDRAIQTAIQRNILERGPEGLALLSRNIGGYRRDILKDQFMNSIEGHGWMERGDCIRRFARWMGFRRTGPSIEDAGRSVINGLIRDGRLISKGSQIRRAR